MKTAPVGSLKPARGLTAKESGLNKDSTECSFDGCNKPIKVKKRQLCTGHYAQWQRRLPLKPLLRDGETPPRCKLEGCTVFSGRFGWCATHQAQVDQGIEPHIVERICFFNGCEKPDTWSGLCVGHGQQRALGKELKPLVIRKPAGGPCSFPSCGRVSYARELCASHYGQQTKGRPLTHIKKVDSRKARKPEDVLFRDEQGRKFCVDCELWLPESDYGPRSNATDGLSAQCRECGIVKRARLKDHRRAQFVERTYNLSYPRYLAMFEAQGHACAACGAKDPRGVNWAVDHDHECCDGRTACGKCVRGILCNLCNLALGVARDDANRLRGMANYLDDWGARAA